MQQRGRQLGPGAAERVAERNGPAVDVDDARVDAEVVHDGEALRGKRFVEFEQPDVFHPKPGPADRLRDRFERADAHDLGGDARQREARHPRQRRQAEVAYHLLGGQHRRGRTVGGLRRVARRHAAARAKHGAKFGQRFEARVGAGAFVHVEHERLLHPLPAVVAHVGDLQRHDLVLEPPEFDGGEGALVALEREGVLGLAGDAPLGGDVLGGDAHRDVQLRIVGDDAGVGLEVKPGHRHHRHRLRAARHDHVGVPGGDGRAGVGDGLQAGGAEAVERGPGHRVGQACLLRNHPSDVHALRAFGKGAAHQHIVHACPVEAGAFEGRPDNRRAHRFGAFVAERAFFAAPDGGTHGGYDISLIRLHRERDRRAWGGGRSLRDLWSERVGRSLTTASRRRAFNSGASHRQVSCGRVCR